MKEEVQSTSVTSADDNKEAEVVNISDYRKTNSKAPWRIRKHRQKKNEIYLKKVNKRSSHTLKEWED